MFGIGTTTALIAVYAGYKLATVFGRSAKEPTPSTEPKSSNE